MGRREVVLGPAAWETHSLMKPLVAVLPPSLCLLHLLSLPTDQTDLQNEFVSVSV